MLGKPEWFTYRVAGWGIAPRTWQGWVYVGAFVALVFTVTALPLSEGTRNVLVAAAVGLFFLDALAIWVRMGDSHDERQRLHQLIIERNCSIAAVFSLVAAGCWQVARHQSTYAAGFPFDPFLLAVLGVMALTKLVSTLYLRWRM
jgi:hypothetical protein